jgi:hypothetical protein
LGARVNSLESDPNYLCGCLETQFQLALRQCCRHALGRSDQIAKQPFIHFQQALVFTQVALVVAQVQYSPDLRAQSHRVGQHLKDDVAVAGAQALGAQRGEAQGVGRAL